MSSTGLNLCEGQLLVRWLPHNQAQLPACLAVTHKGRISLLDTSCCY